MRFDEAAQRGWLDQDAVADPHGLQLAAAEQAMEPRATQPEEALTFGEGQQRLDPSVCLTRAHAF
jgi:hypothetical protein